MKVSTVLRNARADYRCLPYGKKYPRVFLNIALVLTLIAPITGLARDVATDTHAIVSPYYGLLPEGDRHHQFLLAQNLADKPRVAAAADTSSDAETAGRIRFGETSAGKSYLVPAAGIVGFNLLLNRYDYYFIDKKVYGTSLNSIRKNLQSKWVVDTDPFAVNQFLHPYQGSVYFGLGRAAGLDYWESLGYTFGGSLLWEIAGETGPPSINDLVTTGFAGTFLGEPLFRMASLLLEGGGEKPGFWRELGATAISPPLGFTRYAFGDRFRAVFDSHDPATYTYVRLGWNKIDKVVDDVLGQKQNHDTASADFHMSYGLPGKPGYSYTRPFDYFDFEFTASTTDTFENILSRGLLAGKQYALGDNYRGIWGVYGSYDFISPQIFRVSSTAVSLGTTAQWWLSKKVALQGTVLGGVGYGAAGIIHGVGERNYHYGATPQALLSLRLLFGKTANLELTGRSYYVSDVASTEDHGSESIFRGDAAFTVRIHGPHAVTLRYNASQRNAHYPDIASTHQTVRTITLLYTYNFGDAKFGAVEWRSADASE